MASTTKPAAAEVRGHGRTGSSIGWGAIFGGALVGASVMLLLTSLWLALTVGPGTNWVGANVAWFIGGTAIFSMLVAGFLAGWWAGSRGPGTGLVHGLTEWGLVTATSLFAVPGVFSIAAAVGNGPAAPAMTGTAFWTVFWSLLIGLGAALVGGFAGGALAAPGTRARVDVRHLPAQTDRAA